MPTEPDHGKAQRVPPEEVAEDGAVLMPGLEVTYPSLKDNEKSVILVQPVLFGLVCQYCIQVQYSLLLGEGVIEK